MLLSSQTLRSALIQQCFSRYCKRTPGERSTSKIERKHYKIVLNHHFNLVPNTASPCSYAYWTLSPQRHYFCSYISSNLISCIEKLYLYDKLCKYGEAKCFVPQLSEILRRHITLVQFPQKSFHIWHKPVGCNQTEVEHMARLTSLLMFVINVSRCFRTDETRKQQSQSRPVL